jgi:hypothetical protein
MSRNDELIATWELYRQNAQLHRAECDRPLCPICLSPIGQPGEDDAATDAAEASRGHVVPKVAGAEGRGVVPECKTCNSRFGTWYDMPFTSQVTTDRFRSKLLGREDQVKLLSRKGNWLTVNGVPAEAKVKDGGEGICLEAHLKGPAPDLSRGLQLALVDPPVLKVVASLVHSAYLRLVWHLGYEYVFAPSVQGLRQELHRAVTRRHSESELAKPFTRYGLTMQRHDRPDGWMELGIVHDPVSLASFMVPVPGIEGRAYTLFLPGFGSGARGLHERLQGAGGRQIRIRQLKWDAPRERRLAHPDARTWGREFWNEALASPDQPPRDGASPSEWRAA